MCYLANNQLSVRTEGPFFVYSSSSLRSGSIYHKNTCFFFGHEEGNFEDLIIDQISSDEHKES